MTTLNRLRRFQTTLLTGLLLAICLPGCGNGDSGKAAPTVSEVVSNALATDGTASLPGTDIIANVALGEVTLQGTAKSQEEKDRIVSEVRAVPGVKKVIDEVQIK